MKRLIALMICAMPITVIVSQENITVEAEYIEAVNGMYKYHLYVYTPTPEYALSSIWLRRISIDFIFRWWVL